MKKIDLTVIVFFFLLASFAVGQDLPSKGISAHRGENGVFPENTVVGFQEAVRLGARQIELDVQETKDGYFVIMHDTTVDRTTNGKGKVSDLSFEEIRALDAGSKKGPRFAGTKVPTLEESIDAIPKGIWINVHIGHPNPKAALASAELLIKKDRVRDAFLACVRADAQAVKKRYPQMLICNMERQFDKTATQYIQDSIEWKCDFVQLVRLGTPEEMKALKDAGIRINFFAAKNPQHFKELVEAGVDFPLVDDMTKFLDIARELDILPKK